jgi:hypothetical protein
VILSCVQGSICIPRWRYVGKGKKPAVALSVPAAVNCRGPPSASAPLPSGAIALSVPAAVNCRGPPSASAPLPSGAIALSVPAAVNSHGTSFASGGAEGRHARAGAATILPVVATTLHPPFIQRHYIPPSTLDISHQFPARSAASMTQRRCDPSATLELIQSETAALADGFKRAYATGRTQLVGMTQVKQVELFEQVFFAVWQMNVAIVSCDCSNDEWLRFSLDCCHLCCF